MLGLVWLDSSTDAVCELRPYDRHTTVLRCFTITTAADFTIVCAAVLQSASQSVDPPGSRVPMHDATLG